MGKVVVVTDSTAYIPPDLVRRHGLRIAPLTVIWEGSTYRDGVDITPAQFYARLQTSKIIPTTSQTTPDEFMKIFSPIISAGDSVLGVFISSKLSGTVDSAMQVKAVMPGAPITIVDSLSSAMALGFPALIAARAAQEGATLAEAEAVARKAVSCSGVIFVVDTLEYLHRGGRIGNAKHLLGTALSLKPLLEVIDGKVESIESVRTKSKATERLLELITARIGVKKPVRISALHAAAEKEALDLMAAAVSRIHPVEHFLSEVSPAIGTHVGPGTIGIAYCAGM